LQIELDAYVALSEKQPKDAETATREVIDAAIERVNLLEWKCNSAREIVEEMAEVLEEAQRSLSFWEHGALRDRIDTLLKRAKP
jgi:hypothetical protein